MAREKGTGKRGDRHTVGVGCCSRPRTAPPASSRSGVMLSQRLRIQIPVLPQARGEWETGSFVAHFIFGYGIRWLCSFVREEKYLILKRVDPMQARTRRSPDASGGSHRFDRAAVLGGCRFCTLRDRVTLSTSLNLSVARACRPPATLGPQNRSFLSFFHLKSYNRIASILFTGRFLP